MGRMLFAVTRRRAVTKAQYAPHADCVIKAGVLGDDAEQHWYHVCSVADETGNGVPVTEEFLRLYIEDFYSRPEPGPVYLGHADAWLPPGVEEPPARAWVLALELADDGKLWALYELTAKLREAIEEGGYRYNSIYGGMELDDEGNVTGAEFVSIAVTNRPAVPGLTPMAASRTTTRRMAAAGGKTMTDMELMKAALKALGDEATMAQVMRWIEAKKVLDAAEAGEPVEEAPVAEAKKESEEEVKASAEPAADAVTLADEAPAEVDAAAQDAVLAALAQVSGGLPAEELVAVLRDHAAEFEAIFQATSGDGTTAEADALATADASLSVQTSGQELELMRSTVEQLAAKVTQLEGERAARDKAQADAAALARKSDVEAKVEALVVAGRIKDSDRDGWVRLGVNEPEHFTTLTASMKPIIPTGTLVKGRGPHETRVGRDLHTDDENKARFVQMAKRAKIADVEGAWQRHVERTKG